MVYGSKIAESAPFRRQMERKRCWPGVALAALVLFGVTPLRAEETEENPVVRELLDKAVWEVRVFSFENAYKYFKEAKDKSPGGSETWQQAIYGQAVCAQQFSPPEKKKIEEAQQLFGELLKTCPKSKYASRAMMNIGRIFEVSDFYEDAINLEEARAWYQRVVDGWPNDPIAGEATLRVAHTYIQTYDKKQVQKGVEILEAWLKAHPDDPLASAMWQYLAETYFVPLQEYRKSVDCYIRADEIGLMEKGREGGVYWRVARTADKLLKDRGIAVKYYTKIITLVPTSGKAYESQLALKRLGAPVPKLEMFQAFITKETQEEESQAEKKPPGRDAKDSGNAKEAK
jgi:tetratricopeptide (TPR) repeat protein